MAKKKEPKPTFQEALQMIENYVVKVSKNNGFESQSYKLGVTQGMLATVVSGLTTVEEVTASIRNSCSL